MHGFESAHGGHSARLTAAEATVLARLVADIAELLGTDVTAEDTPPGAPGRSGRPGGDPVGAGPGAGPDVPGDGPEPHGGPGPVPGKPRPGERPGPGGGPGGAGPIEGVLAALDFTPTEAATTPADPAVARLLPPMSQDDPELAAELRALTEDGLRAGKVERLRAMYRALRAATADGRVRVPAGREGDWLAAMTDVRLVLAVRLGIEDEADAEEVYQRAERGGGDEVAEAMATMYAALTWWQESLLQAMRRRGRRR